MKRRCLCIICLVLYILISCTILSLKIEKEMLTQVEVLKIKDKGMWGQSVSVSQTALFEDEWGKHLYELVEGAGWESGLRVREIPQDGYELDYEKGTIRLPGGKDYCFIMTASRQPVVGELVEIIDSKNAQLRQDTLLFVYPMGRPEGQPDAEGLSVIAQSEKAALREVEHTTACFFEHKQMGKYQSISDADWRIFSMETAYDFWSQLPLAAMLAVLLLAVMILWVFSFSVCVSAYDPKRLFVFTGIIGGVSLRAICLILRNIDMPSAMLPDTNILNLRHYFGELKIMLSGLETIPSAMQAFTELKATVVNQCAAILAVGLLLTGIAILFARKYICRASSMDDRGVKSNKQSASFFCK